MPTAVKKSEYGRRHDRLRRRGAKLNDKALDQPFTEKGEKKYQKLKGRSYKNLRKAEDIRNRRDKKS